MINNLLKKGIVLLICLVMFPLVLAQTDPVATHTDLHQELDLVTFQAYVIDMGDAAVLEVYYRYRKVGHLLSWKTTPKQIVHPWSGSQPQPLTFTLDDTDLNRGTTYEYRFCYDWGSNTYCEPHIDQFITWIDIPTITSPDVEVLDTSVVRIKGDVHLNDFTSVSAHVRYKKVHATFWSQTTPVLVSGNSPQQVHIPLYNLDTNVGYEARICINWDQISYTGEGKGYSDDECFGNLFFTSDAYVHQPSSQLFPDWGFRKIITGEYNNIIDASTATWRNAGSNNLGMLLAFATLPFIIMVMVFVRTRKVYATAFALLVSTFAIHVFGFLDTSIARPIYIISTLMLVLSITALWGRK